MNAKRDRVFKELSKALRQADSKGTSGYDTTAEVVRVEGDTVWVHIPGGVDETPVKKTIDAVKGDTVQLRVSGGTAWIVGNETKPPTDDRVANVAKKTAKNADLKAILAKKTANEASKVATNYIDFTEEEGLTVGHKNLESKVNISGGGIKLYDEEGNVGTEIKSGQIMIGNPLDSRVLIKQKGFEMLDADNTAFVRFQDERVFSTVDYYFYIYRASGETNEMEFPYTILEVNEVLINDVPTSGYSFEGDSVYLDETPDQGDKIEIYAVIFAPVATLERTGFRNYTNPDRSIAFITPSACNLNYEVYLNGVLTEPTQRYKTQAIFEPPLSDDDEVRIVYQSIASDLKHYTIGSRQGETGQQSYVLGNDCIASGKNSFAIGYNTKAIGSCSFSANASTEAQTDYSSAFGRDTIAKGLYQTVVGTFNYPTGEEHIASHETPVFIVGNGAVERSNAFAVNYGGDIHIKGDAYVGCNADSTGGRKLVSASVNTGNGTKSNVPSGASNLTNLAEVSLDEEGVYLLLGRVRFASNTSGRRGAAWASNPTGYFYHSLVVGAPANGGATLMQTMAIIEVTSNTAPYTAYLNCYHTAGASNPLDVEYYWRYIKLA